MDTNLIIAVIPVIKDDTFHILGTKSVKLKASTKEASLHFAKNFF